MGAFTMLLHEGVDLASEKTSVASQHHLNGRRIPVDTGHADAIGRTEVAKAVGDETFLVDFNGTHHVGAMPVDEVGTAINADACKLSQTSSIFTEKRLTPIRQMAKATTLAASMKADNENVAALTEVANDASHLPRFLVSERIAIMPKGTESIFDAAYLFHDTLLVPLDTSKANALFCQATFGAANTIGAEIVCMVVCQAQKVKPGFRETGRKTCGHAETIAVGTAAFCRLPSICHGPFKVATCHIGTPQQITAIAEELAAFIGW